MEDAGGCRDHGPEHEKATHGASAETCCQRAHFGSFQESVYLNPGMLSSLGCSFTECHRTGETHKEEDDLNTPRGSFALLESVRCMGGWWDADQEAWPTSLRRDWTRGWPHVRKAASEVESAIAGQVPCRTVSALSRVTVGGGSQPAGKKCTRRPPAAPSGRQALPHRRESATQLMASAPRSTVSGAMSLNSAASVLHACRVKHHGWRS